MGEWSDMQNMDISKATRDELISGSWHSVSRYPHIQTFTFISHSTYFQKFSGSSCVIFLGYKSTHIFVLFSVLVLFSCSHFLQAQFELIYIDRTPTHFLRMFCRCLHFPGDFCVYWRLFPLNNYTINTPTYF